MYTYSRMQDNKKGVLCQRLTKCLYLSVP
uniref:Uncharacterized protein n=1 Tax=Arundo donax TaxID=35708 RepID=A0A0A8ZAV5_ARUDO